MKAKRVDLIVVGAGPAGLSAAAEVSGRGGRVVVLDESAVPGGRLPGQLHRDPKHLWRLKKKWVNGKQRALRLVQETRRAGVDIHCGVSVWNVCRTDSTWHVCICPTVPGIDKPSHGFAYEAEALVVATGAVQKPLPFSGWTLPGVFTAGAAQTMINLNGVLPGKRVLVVGFDPLGVSVTQLLSACGVHVAGMVLPPDNGFSCGAHTPSEALAGLVRMTQKPNSPVLEMLYRIGKPFRAAVMGLFPEQGVTFMGMPLMLRRSLRAAHGRDRVNGVEIVALDANGVELPRSREKWCIDAVVTSCGLAPLVELAQLAGCPLARVPDLGGWVPVHGANFETPLPGLFLSGSITGVEGASVAENQGRIAGVNASFYLGLTSVQQAQRDFEIWNGRLDRIRAATPGLLPEVQAGRAKMAEQWRACNR